MVRAHFPDYGGVSAWWLAARSFQPSLSLAAFTASVGRLAETRYDLLLCRRGGELEPPPDLRLLGLRSATVEAAAVRTRGRRAVVWIDRARAGRVVATSGSEWRLEVADTVGAIAEEVVSVADAGGAALFEITPEPGHRLPRAPGTTAVLAEWAAAEAAGPRAVACGRKEALVWSYRGMAAHVQWLAALRRQDAPAASDAPRAAEWATLRRLGAAYLRELPQSRRGPLAVRLRRAAEGLEAEASVLDELGTVLRRRRRGSRTAEARVLLAEAVSLAERAIADLTDAALEALGAAASVRCALTEPSEHALAGTALHEVLYLARAGVPTLRTLAARRLGGASGEQARATLAQLLYDGDPRVIETALAALHATAPPPHLARAALAALRAALADGRDLSTVCALLLAALESGDREALAAVRGIAGSPQGSPSIRRLLAGAVGQAATNA